MIFLGLEFKELNRLIKAYLVQFIGLPLVISYCDYCDYELIQVKCNKTFYADNAHLMHWHVVLSRTNHRCLTLQMMMTMTILRWSQFFSARVHVSGHPLGRQLPHRRHLIDWLPVFQWPVEARFHHESEKAGRCVNRRYLTMLMTLRPFSVELLSWCYPSMRCSYLEWQVALVPRVSLPRFQYLSSSWAAVVATRNKHCLTHIMT